MALQSCYECGKEISSKAIMCPQCGAPQNPASGLVDKTKRFFAKLKEEKRKKRKLLEEKEYEQGFLRTLMKYFRFIFKILLIYAIVGSLILFYMLELQ
jgi:hypothetical protein